MVKINTPIVVTIDFGLKINRIGIVFTKSINEMIIRETDTVKKYNEYFV